MYVLSHHEKNRVMKYNFIRSGQIVSRHFHAVLQTLLSLHGELFKAPEPITQDGLVNRWLYF